MVSLHQWRLLLSSDPPVDRRDGDLRTRSGPATAARALIEQACEVRQRLHHVPPVYMRPRQWLIDGTKDRGRFALRRRAREIEIE